MRHDSRPARPGATQDRSRHADALAGPAMSEAQCAAPSPPAARWCRPCWQRAAHWRDGHRQHWLRAVAGAPNGSVHRAVCRPRHGLDDAGLARSGARAARCWRVTPKRPHRRRTGLRRLQIAMMSGAVLQAALERRVIVVDGFIASSAVLIAARLQPTVLSRCVRPLLRRSRPCADASRPGGATAVDPGPAAGRGSRVRWPGRCSIQLAGCWARWPAFESAGVSRQSDPEPGADPS